MTNETAAEQRKRILDASLDTSPFQYDSAVALGYQPESWDGMWKLPIGHPITWITKRTAVVREIVYKPGSHDALLRGNRPRTRRRIRRVSSARL